jgi:CubicO group peptidase (beta-lactamase class C family)
VTLGPKTNNDGRSELLPCSQTRFSDSTCSYGWYGAATTSFWVDPSEDFIVLFMTQCLPAWAYSISRELRTLVYSAIIESNL